MKAINVLLALLVSFGLAFGVAELGLRLLGFAPPAINTEFDAKLGWRKEANSTIHRSSPEYDVTIRTDAHGLRDDYDAAEIPAKPEGTTRMLFLGDSFTLGYTVEREDLFVDLLEKAWRDEGRSVEIVNAGTQAYSTDQALAWLEENGAKFSPDAVVLFPYENDIWWNAQDTYLGQPKPLYGENGERASSGDLTEGKRRGWFGKTAVGNLLRPKAKMPRLDIGGLEISVERSSQLIAPPEETRVAEARTRVLMQKMSDTVAGMGAKFAVCPIPSREAVTAPKKLPAGTDPARPYELLTEAARAAGASVIPVRETLQLASEKGWSPYYARDFHLNAQGNLLLAQELKTRLEAEAADLVPAPSGAAEAKPVTLVNLEGSGEPPVPPSKAPTWPFWYAGLVVALGTLYSRTYPDENTGLAYLKVAGLLGVVFATALGVTALMGALSPLAAKLLLVGLVIAILTFVLFKLGDRVGTITELMKAFTLRGHWYLMPLLTVLLTVGSLLVVAASSPLVAPFIYTLF